MQGERDRDPRPEPPSYRLDRGDPRDACRVLGAHPELRDGTPGTRFATWAPRAAAVAVAGDWNGWRGDPLRADPDTGIWHGFVPHVGFGARYKFAVTAAAGAPPVLKADPFARWAELRPANASRVWAPSGFAWDDAAWMEARADRQSVDGPIAIYEVHLGSWQRSPGTPDLPLGYRDLAHRLADHARSMGYTHVELLPVTEHPLDASWGYQVTGYFAPTARHGQPDDFRYLVDHLHRAGVGVILDWVPAHFCKDEHGLGRFDGQPLFEHADPLRGEHPTWDTYQFDLGRPEVRTFLLASALHWLEEFHVDGLRVDAVASMAWLDHGRAPGRWRPNPQGGTLHEEAIDFLRRLNAVIHREVPDALTFAEDASAYQWVTRRERSSPRAHPPGTPVDASTPRPVMPGPEAFHPDGGESLGFDAKWNMGWMNDTLRYLGTDPDARAGMGDDLTFPAWFASDERFVLPLSHDEVVHLKRALVTKLPGSDPLRFAGLRALYAYQYAHPGRKLLFMGGEFGQWAEWQEDRSLDWHLLRFAGEGGSQTRYHRGVQALVRILNGLYRGLPALHARDNRADGFLWLRADTAPDGLVAFARLAGTGLPPVAVACNFSREAVRYAFPVPVGRRWREILNTDDAAFGGSGTVNSGVLVAGRPRGSRTSLPDGDDDLAPPSLPGKGIGGLGRGGGVEVRPLHPARGVLREGVPSLEVAAPGPSLKVTLAPHAVAYLVPSRASVTNRGIRRATTSAYQPS